MLEVKGISGGYNGNTVIERLSFEVKKGEIFGILGPNGSGKTTLLNTLTHLNPPTEGTILLKGRKLESYSPKSLAKITAVLPQFTEPFFTYKVKEIVSLGRYPYQKGLFKQPSMTDLQAIERAMKQTEVMEFAEKSIQSLSGGEKQRVFLAQALAQEPELLLLDEPTNHLDISHQKHLLDGLKKWVAEQGLTVIAIFHDLNLAGLYCDRLLLLKNGLKEAIGTPKEILNERTVFSVYGTEVRQLFHPDLPRPLMIVSPEKSSEENVRLRLSELHIEQSEDMIRIDSPIDMKTFSSAVVGAGFSWKRCFVNRHVAGTYDSQIPEVEMKGWLEDRGMQPVETVAMMTAVCLEDAAIRTVEEQGFSIKVLVTAGTGDAVDVSLASRHGGDGPTVGTINGWIFVDGFLSEEAFVQAVMTATEAKVKALQQQGVKDFLTGTLATGTATDSLLVAASQRGEKHPFAGTGTTLGKAIGRAVYECTIEAINKDRKRREG
ncbi:MAG TPA: adenosylcobinamide amidohydrolase [Bacillales bacterium]|nr:adenosylcobinamide amidohydrolase [Bacillales bacterium]